MNVEIIVESEHQQIKKEGIKIKFDLIDPGIQTLWDSSTALGTSSRHFHLLPCFLGLSILSKLDQRPPLAREQQHS